jgi:hypothetical protein
MICIAKEWFLIKIILQHISSPQGIYNIEFSTAQAAQQQKNKKILNSTSCTTTESKEQQHYKILNITTKFSTAQLNNRIKKYSQQHYKILNITTEQKKKKNLNNTTK